MILFFLRFDFANSFRPHNDGVARLNHHSLPVRIVAISRMGFFFGEKASIKFVYQLMGLRCINSLSEWFLRVCVLFLFFLIRRCVKCIYRDLMSVADEWTPVAAITSRSASVNTSYIYASDIHLCE